MQYKVRSAVQNAITFSRGGGCVKPFLGQHCCCQKVGKEKLQKRKLEFILDWKFSSTRSLTFHIKIVHVYKKKILVQFTIIKEYSEQNNISVYRSFVIDSLERKMVRFWNMAKLIFKLFDTNRYFSHLKMINWTNL